MAYIDAAETKIIRNNLKKAYPEMKFSVRNRDHMKVNVTILSGPYAFELNGRDYREVNQYHFDTDMDKFNYQDELVKAHTHRDILRGILEIISEKHWDKSDMQTDYFNCAFYYDLSIGEYGKPYVNTSKKTEVDSVTGPARYFQPAV